MRLTVQSLLATRDVEFRLREATFVELFDVIQTVRAQMGDLGELHDALLLEFDRRGIQPPKRRNHADDDP